MPSKVLKDGTVLTFDDATQAIRVLPKASILIEDDHIAAIAEKIEDLAVPPDSEIINVQGKIVSPGFVNTHIHSWQSVFRTVGPNIVLAQYFVWLSQKSPMATTPFTPDDIYISCLEGYLEGLNAGVTSYVEHAHNNWSAEVVEPGHEAAVDSGARVWWCYDIAPRDEFPESEQWDVLGRIRSKTAPSSPVQLGLSLDGLAHSYLSGSPDKQEYMKEKIRDLNLEAFTVHHLGGPWPQGYTSPSKVCEGQFQNTGLPIIFSHASYLTSEDQSALREHDLSISITPESEFHYGHDQTTGHLMSDKASLGVDTNYTFSGDILSQARLWLQTVRKTYFRKTLETGRLPKNNPMTVEQGFLLATRQGGRALRRSDVGVIQVGAKADLVVFNGDSPNMLGWSDPVAAVMLHANTGDVEHVIVNGEFRKRDFQLVTSKLGWPEVRTRFLEASRRIQPQVVTPPPLPEKLWGIGEMGEVDTATTIRPS